MGMYDYDKNDSCVRIAILEEYRYKDFYNNKKITYNDLEIDHIIPQDFFKSNKSLEEIKKKYSLNDDFTENSLLNYVPTSRVINNRKSNRLLSDYVMSSALAIAKDKAPKIVKRINKLKKEENIDTLVANVNSNLKSKEEIAAFINKVFMNDNEELKEISELSYTNSKRKVSIQAFAPDNNNFFKGFCINFNNIEISGACITPNYEVMSNYLFSYVNFPYNRRKGFYIASINEQNSIIQIGDNRLQLDDKNIIDFCDIIDDFYLWYTDRLIENEKEEKTLNFPLFNRNNYLVGIVSEKTWMIFQEYIKNCVEKNGFDGFEYNESSIKVWNGKYGQGFHLYLKAKKIEKYIYILWDKGISEADWEFQKAMHWFYGEFLQDVKDFLSTYSKMRKNIFMKPKIDVDLSCINIYKPHLVFIDIEGPMKNEAFFNTILCLEEFCLIRNDVLLTNEEMAMYFRAMILLIIKDDNERFLPYFLGNLSFLQKRKVINDIKNISDLLKNIEKEIDKIDKGEGLEYSFDLTFRNIKVCTEHCYTKLTQSEITLILALLSPLIDHYNRRLILDKFGDHTESHLANYETAFCKWIKI